MFRLLILSALVLGLSTQETEACHGLRGIFRGAVCGGVQSRTVVRQRVRVLHRGRLRASCAGYEAQGCAGRAVVAGPTCGAPQPQAACPCGEGCTCAGNQGGECNCGAQSTNLIQPTYVYTRPRQMVCVGGQCFLQ